MTYPLADSYVTRLVHQAELATSHKLEYYSIPTSMSGISLNSLQLKLWASSTIQLVTWTTLVGRWLSTLARLERLASCIRDVSVLIQRYNTMLLHDGLSDDFTDWCTTCSLTFASSADRAIGRAYAVFCPSVVFLSSATYVLVWWLNGVSWQKQSEEAVSKWLMGIE